MRRCDVRSFPTAINLAVHIQRNPAEWHASECWLSHATLGRIWLNGVRHIRVETKQGLWHPGRIEQRIIQDAVAWRLGPYLKHHIDSELRQHALPLEGRVISTE